MIPSKPSRCCRATVLALVCVPLVAFASIAGAVEVQRVAVGDLEAWLVEDHTNPIIAVDLAFRGGAATDPADKAGRASMAASLLDEGAGDLDSAAFQRRLEDLAIELRFDAGHDSVNGHMKTLTKNSDAAFDLLGLALSAPRFDAEPVARVRSQMKAALRRDSEDPESVASRRWFAAMFPDHPYGRPVEGTSESVAAIAVDDLRSFTKARLARDVLVIGVVGDITPAELSPRLRSAFGKLPATAAPADVADVAPSANGATIVVSHPTPQSAIVFGQRGPKRNDPDFYTATALSQILGGGFTSRLYQEVREERGLAYSVYTTLVPLDHAGLLLGRAGTVNERVGDTVEVVREVWRRLAADRITAERLDDAKTYLTGSFPLRFTSTGSIAATLVWMQLDHLGIDYLDRRNALIEAVTLDGVNRLAKSLLDAQALTFVIAGEPKGLPAREEGAVSSPHSGG